MLKSPLVQGEFIKLTGHPYCYVALMDMYIMYIHTLGIQSYSQMMILSVSNHLRNPRR